MTEFDLEGTTPVTVLLVEDEVLIRFDMAEEMRLAGWKVIEVGTADEAIVVVNSAIHIDILVTDVNMPGRADGIELAGVVRRERPHSKIVLMSGMPQLSVTDAVFDAFFLKPFLSPTLVERLHAFIKPGNGAVPAHIQLTEMAITRK